MINRLIYGVGLAPFVKKIMLACDYKKLAYESVLIVPPAKMSEHFLKISPLKKIPVLEEDGFSIADSSVIAAYLEKAYPEHAIYPQDAKQYAQVLWIEEYADTVLNEVCGHRIFVKQIVMPRVLKKPVDDNLQDAVAQLPALFDYIELFIKQLPGHMIVGDHVTIADLALAVQFICLHHCDISINTDQWPKLAGYVERLFNEPLIKASIQADHNFLSSL